jgi:hypothetical protein
MKAALVDRPSDRPERVFEPKLDGFRMLAYVDGREVRLVSRNEKAQEVMFHEVAAGLQSGRDPKRPRSPRRTAVRRAVGAAGQRVHAST